MADDGVLVKFVLVFVFKAFEIATVQLITIKMTFNIYKQNSHLTRDVNFRFSYFADTVRRLR